MNRATLIILIQGLVRLVEGQKQFAEEFGLHMNRLFPDGEDNLQEENLTVLISQWLTDAASEKQLQALFDALVKHQLALMAALDGLVLHTLEHITANSTKLRLPFPLTPIDKHCRALKENQRLRYQKLIAPGFIENYIKIREAL